MPTTPPLPTVTGRTENALRALLTKTLSTTPISSYRGWVVLNAVEANASASATSWRAAVADALKVEQGTIDEVLDELRSTDLVDDHDAVTSFGRVELSAARAVVSATTARLVEDLSEAEQETTRSVLDRVRIRAEELLHA
ncbi:hypothetical protein [Microbacterium paraoxydans]|uniref:hypothetical protein n=1 Tax=Microbacterium paraoxydans TaxID=199592 RepID=UPI001CFA2284|nr:hypothetical protein [Microbacterium paraoxydans]